jgi:hypothetical protein
VLNPAYEESASRMYQQASFTTAVPVFGGEVIHVEKMPPVAPKLRFE